MSKTKRKREREADIRDKLHFVSSPAHIEQNKQYQDIDSGAYQGRDCQKKSVRSIRSSVALLTSNPT